MKRSQRRVTVRKLAVSYATKFVLCHAGLSSHLPLCNNSGIRIRMENLRFNNITRMRRSQQAWIAVIRVIINFHSNKTKIIASSALYISQISIFLFFYYYNESLFSKAVLYLLTLIASVIITKFFREVIISTTWRSYGKF